MFCVDNWERRGKSHEKSERNSERGSKRGWEDTTPSRFADGPRTPSIHLKGKYYF